MYKIWKARIVVFRKNDFRNFIGWSIGLQQIRHIVSIVFFFLNDVNSSNISALVNEGFDNWKRVNQGRTYAFLAHIGSAASSPQTMYVRWLALQGCAFRGNDVSLSSSNRGNFLELVKAFAKMNTEIDEVVLENAPKNAQYIAPEIQKVI
ncbi:uncharacterized protein LOC142530629 [Primulina tabacum]|uniref:uncharacterized protein LOC142530629 n=1 Tax=Primulina tabacum TaxID=48773 RepID=UPI003F59357B